MRKLNKLFVGVGVLVIVVASVILLSVRYYNSSQRSVPQVYSNYSMLRELWETYKREYIEPGTFRTLDKQQTNITTSEGQSYTMLRAVWMDDKETFDRSWKWTKDNIQRDDSLMSWKFGLLPDGSYGIQTNVNGQNTASDADQDIALSLLMAYNRWNEDDYYYDALPIIDNIWKKQVVEVQGKPLLAANDIERLAADSIIVNPSYFAPYAYKVFAKVDADKTHRWTALADNSYDLIAASSSANLDKSSSTGLPPNWFKIAKASGELSVANSTDLNTDYSYDAMRVPFRLAMDWSWFKDDRAKTQLSKFSFLQDQWSEKRKLNAEYTHDGTVKGDYESPAVYGGSLGYFDVINRGMSDDLYRNKLQTLYNPDTQSWQRTLSYYDDNWAWFGIALHQGALVNLTTDNRN